MNSAFTIFRKLYPAKFFPLYKIICPLYTFPNFLIWSVAFTKKILQSKNSVYPQKLEKFFYQL